MGRILHHEGEQPERQIPRLRLGIPARLETIHGPKKAVLIDISQGGAQVELGERSPAREGMLFWLRFEFFFTVSWREDRRLGLAFDEPLPLGVLRDTRLFSASMSDKDERAVADEAHRWAIGL